MTTIKKIYIFYILHYDFKLTRFAFNVHQKCLVLLLLVLLFAKKYTHQQDNFRKSFRIVVVSLFFFVLFKTPLETENVMAMEQLPINNHGGQGYGFILYQKELDTIPREITIHNISDRAQVLQKSPNCRMGFVQ